ncbi:MAG: hypothetical protein LE180_01350 [Endomicrobium sp.]|uniref:hypothetical protein n=1 Tax=Candidatus Endomicrobiellum pyrsonymphae TaxID=1408203 RepID=UPI003574E6BC|nr:hypothetical protein [Endomicrobium sp.]
MKKYFFTIIFIFTFSSNVFCFSNFIENTDYFVEFHEKSSEMAAILHIKFVSVVPEAEGAEKIVKEQLKKYGNILTANKKNVTTLKKEVKYKNIIGSAWYVNDADPENLTKINFKKDLGAYVWLGKTNTIVSFPNYMSFLKKEKEKKNLKNKNIRNQQQINIESVTNA